MQVNDWKIKTDFYKTIFGVNDLHLCDRVHFKIHCMISLLKSGKKGILKVLQSSKDIYIKFCWSDLHINYYIKQ